ncbi:MAG: putative ribosomal RNA small subunit methyltransferase A [Promethearchaeota archaeon]|nr:MAG: putative ribosomal RNA small subunit methyltransferase A [Candidatus Lokiarchaeota archaeon]
MNKKDVISILKNLRISPKKHLGQNFLINELTTSKIIEFSNISEDDIILEVGSGLGALTEKLSGVAQNVYAYEIDANLYRYLSDKFAKRPNVQIIHQDILKAELPPHNKIVSNIPYSITGPLLEKVFFKSSPPNGNLVIEKSISDRIFYKKEYHNFSRITVSVNSFMNPIKRVQISKNSFYPRPKIDLSLIKLKPKKELPPFLEEESTRDFFLKFIAGIMPYKNKNLSNAIGLFLKRFRYSDSDKNQIKRILKEIQLKDGKTFQLELDKFPELAQKIYHLTELGEINH